MGAGERSREPNRLRLGLRTGYAEEDETSQDPEHCLSRPLASLLRVQMCIRDREHTISKLKTANNELQKDIQEKIQIDEMRKEFLSNVSHELKTPIALIQGYAEGLKECINDDEQSRDFYCCLLYTSRCV